MERRRKLQLAFVLVLILLLVAAVPGKINMGRHKARLAQTLSIELGRDVTMGDIALHLLPQPGFTIDHGFTIADDPAFSAEPLLHAESVNADLRFTSLWRGRIEIAKISFNSPSLNLVRGSNGHWNLESLLLRASQIPSAPTPQRHAEARPRFPYIEATDGRINFKSGLVKSPFALTEADFSFYLESDDRWNARLEAKPVRTDMPISDTGTVTARARLGRAPTFDAMPIEGTLNLQDAQLGQISKLLFGTDQGWRGGFDADLSGRGRINQLQLAAKLRVNQFRRFDVAASDSIALSADCSASLNYLLNSQGISRRSLDAIACTAPLGDGTLGLHGSYSGPSGSELPEFDLTVEAHALPANELALIYRNANQNVASDLQAKGKADANFTFAQTSGAPERITGSGIISGLQIKSSRLTAPLALDTPVRFSAAQTRPTINRRQLQPAMTSYSIVIAPFTLPAIGTFSGTFNSSLYQIALRTEADVPDLVRVARTFGMPVPFTAHQGHAIGNLNFNGRFTGFQRAAVSGDLDLTNVAAGTVPKEIHITSAHLAFTDTNAQLRNLRASIPSANLDATGDISVMRPCSIVLDCHFIANLHVAQVDVTKLRPLIAADSGFFHSLFDRSSWLEQNRSVLSRLNVMGTLRIDHLRNASLTLADNALTNFHLTDSKLKLTNTMAAFAGGRIFSDSALADLSGTAPSYTVSSKLDRVGLSALLDFFGPANASGIVNADLHLQMDGDNIAAIAKSASGSAQFELLNGTLGQERDVFHYRRVAGTLNIADQHLKLAGTTAAQSSGKPWQATGDVNFARTMDLSFTRANDHLTVTAPLTGSAQKSASK